VRHPARLPTPKFDAELIFPYLGVDVIGVDVCMPICAVHLRAVDDYVTAQFIERFESGS
jgi:hypothetical protein